MSKDRYLDIGYLKDRAECTVAAGYSCPKWISFAQTMLEAGFKVWLHEARKTPSKYLTVSRNNKSFRVRFSNHKPIEARELRGDCDFFVGHTNLTITNTQQAIKATYEHFGLAVEVPAAYSRLAPAMFGDLTK